MSNLSNGECVAATIRHTRNDPLFSVFFVADYYILLLIETDWWEELIENGWILFHHFLIEHELAQQSQISLWKPSN